MPSTVEMETDLAVAAQASLLESFAESVALLDAQGRILAVNRAWREAGAAHTPNGHAAVVGAPGLEICDQLIGPDSPEAAAVARGIRAVLDRTAAQYSVEFAGHTLDEQHWYRLIVSPLTTGAIEGALAMRQEVTESRQTAERLRDSQAMLNVASRVGRLGAWRLDYPGPAVVWSDEVRAIHEVTPDFTPTMDDGLAFYLPEYRVLIQDSVRACLENALAFDVKAEIRTAKGRRLWVRVIGEAVTAPDGSIRQLQGAFQDIDESETIHTELKRTMKRLSTTLESMSDGVLFMDREWRILEINAEAEVLVKRGREGMYGRKLWDVFPGMESGPVHERYQQAMLTNVAVRFETFYEGLNEWFEVHAFPSLDGLAIYFHNITDRKRTEQQLLDQAERLRASENEYRALFATNPQPMWVFDEDSLRFLAVNSAAIQQYGYSEEEFLSLTLLDIRPPEEVPAIRSHLTGPRPRPSGRIGQFRHRRKDGSLIDVEVSSNPIGVFAAKSARVVSVHDVTGKVQAEREARRAQRMESIGTLAGGVAHDLNNLLSPISLGIGLLRESVRDPESLESIATMERSAKRAAAVVRQLLSFARGAEGARVPVRIHGVIAEVAEIAESTFPKNIQLHVRSAPSLWAALADATQVHQALLNLCLNARDALPAGGRIDITASNAEIDEHFSRMHRGLQPGRFVLIEVADTGTGIAPEIIDRIFEPFFTTKGVGQGSGLGLSNVLGIVRGHGGWVGVASRPGKGSTFKVYLPCALEAELPTNGAATALTHGHGELVLLVDDELPILQITAKTLRAFGYKVLIAEDGARALGLVAMHHEEIKVVLTDMMMPGMDGAKLIATLRRMQPGVPVIASSGHNAADNAVGAVEAGAQRFLAKPYTAEAMLGAISAVLTGPPEPSVRSQ